jgi:hypothetical protein
VDATCEVSGRLWEGGGKATWVFVTLPPELVDEIGDRVPQKGGFGSVEVNVRIGETDSSTSLAPDRSVGSHVLPIRRAVRERGHLPIGATVDLVMGVVVT